MDPLASSHTAGSRAGRCQLVMLFALALLCKNIVIVAAAPDSVILHQGVHGVAKDSLARLLIRGELARANDGQDRDGSEVRASVIGMRRVEGWRSSPGDVPLPGMWPTSSGQDDVSPVAEDSSEQTEHSNQNLPTVSGRIVVPDADRTSHHTVESEPQSISLLQNLRVQEPRFRSRSLLQGDISPPGMWPDSDDDESQLPESLLLRRRRLMNL